MYKTHLKGLCYAFGLALKMNVAVLAQTDIPSVETLKRIENVEKNLKGFVVREGQEAWTLKDRMARYGIQALSIAVIKDYKIEWEKAYGWSDKDLKVPVTVKTLFQAGSVSKSINALGALKLAQDNLIDLNLDINTYLKTWRFPYDNHSSRKKITLTNLLNHTAGLNVEGFSGYIVDQKLPTDVQILNGVKPANSPAVRSEFEPGIKYQYSGGGSTIAQLLISDVSKQAYETFMKDSILDPLGMQLSTYVQPSSSQKPEDYATGYVDGRAVKRRFHIYPEKAAAGLWSTPRELARFVIEIQSANAGKPTKIINNQSAQLMLEPGLEESGLGVFIRNYKGTKYFEHSGLTYGFQTQFFGSVDGGNGVVIMLNSPDDRIITELVNSVASVYGFSGLNRSITKRSFEVNENVLNMFAGTYSFGKGLTTVISVKDKQLELQMKGQPVLVAYPDSPTTFYFTDLDAQLSFTMDIEGKVRGVTLIESGEKVEGKRIR